MFGILRNCCIYNRVIFRILAFLEPEASSKICQTCKMIQSPGMLKTVYSSIFKDIQTYSGILMHIQPHSQMRNQRGERRPPLPFLKIENVLILERKAMIVSIFEFSFPFKISFTSESVYPRQAFIIINIKIIRKNISIYPLHVAYRIFSKGNFTFIIKVRLLFTQT